jgi:hypothetical protein
VIVYKNDYYELTRAPTGVFRLVRSTKPFQSTDELSVAHDAMLAALESHHARALLIDLRNAPLKSDPEFESVFAPYRTRITRGAARVAVLVRSKVGALQVQRLAKTDRASSSVFDDEMAAVEWLAKT